MTGTVKKKLTAPTDITAQRVTASPEHLQQLVEIASSDQAAAYKPEALKLAKAK